VIYIPVYGGASIQSIFWQNDCLLHDENNHITIPGFMTMSKNYLLKELKWQKPL
jgi:hypothetical protein